MSNCKFCDLNIFQETMIHDFDRRIWVLNRNQFLLGNSMLILKKHKEELFSLTKDEISEGLDIMKSIEEHTRKSFSPDWFNYLQTNNSIRHFHFHIIPRYKSGVTYQNITFKDTNFYGMPDIHNQYLNTEIMNLIIKDLKQHITL